MKSDRRVTKLVNLSWSLKSSKMAPHRLRFLRAAVKPTCGLLARFSRPFPTRDSGVNQKKEKTLAWMSCEDERKLKCWTEDDDVHTIYRVQTYIRLRLHFVHGTIAAVFFIFHLLCLPRIWVHLPTFFMFSVHSMNTGFCCNISLLFVQNKVSFASLFMLSLFALRSK